MKNFSGLNVTSLQHPTIQGQIMIGLKYAFAGKGHLMGGHDRRVYVKNRLGSNIMRLDAHTDGGFTAWIGGQNVTSLVIRAMNRQFKY
jgi:hypothetical protein